MFVFRVPLRLAQVCFFLIVLAVSSQAEEIWIKNRAFPGQVVKEGGQVWVEVLSFAKALGMTATLDGETAVIDGKSLPVTKKGDVSLVNLAESVKALGGVLRANKEMGTLDVFLGVKEQDPSALAAGDDDSATPDSKAIKMAAYAVTVPPDMQLSRDAQTLKAAGLEASGAAAEVSSKYGVKDSAKVTFDALVFHKGDSSFKRGFGALAYSTVNDAIATVTPEQINAVQTAALEMAGREMGARPLGPIAEEQIGGRTFHVLNGVIPASGVQIRMRLAIDQKRRRQYLMMVMAVAPSDLEDFEPVFTSAQLR
jgi:hypothetical protein